MSKALTRIHSTLLPQIDLEDLCDFVVNGGTLYRYCSEKGLPYQKVRNWIGGNEYNKEKYDESMVVRDERTKQMLVGLITEMSSFDPGEVFNDKGDVLPIKEWPAGARAALSSYERSGITGDSKVRFIDRLAAARLIGKELGIFQDKVKVEGKLTLADLVKSAGEIGEK